MANDLGPCNIFLALLPFERQSTMYLKWSPYGRTPERTLMKFRPLHDRGEGKVVAVGPGSRDESGKLIPPDVKAGDFILFDKWSGTEVRIDDQDQGERLHGHRREDNGGRQEAA